MNKPIPEFDGFDPGQPGVSDLDFQALALNDGGVVVASPVARTTYPLLALLGCCISRLSDSVLITEAEPLDHPGRAVIGRQDIVEGKTALPALEQIDIAAVRARGLIRQILAYGRRQPQMFVRQPLAVVVRQAVDLLRATLPAGVGLTLTVRDPLLEVLADATQIQQVLLNLGTNAWHAMRGGQGNIAVEVSRLVVPGRPVPRLRSTDLPASIEHYALVTLVDDGCGMDEENRLRIFEPYFTSKSIGRGTGLGLAVVWGIVSSHGGTIHVESEVGKGTSVSLVFPLLPELETQALPTPVSPPAVPLRASGQRVMVIDDDEVVLQMFQGILSRAGFDVRSFADPCKAIGILTLEPNAFDVIVTDLNMPELSGLQFAAAVADIRADLPVVLGSGFVDDELTGVAASAGIAAVFRKEEATERLSSMLLDVLAAPFVPMAR